MHVNLKGPRSVADSGFAGSSSADDDLSGAESEEDEIRPDVEADLLHLCQASGASGAALVPRWYGVWS